MPDATGPSMVLPAGMSGASPTVATVAVAEAGTATDIAMTTRSDRLSSTAPVSYTHLDVYKRQVHPLDVESKVIFTVRPELAVAATL